MSLIPTIETERLILRAPQMSDFDPLAAHWELERTEYIGGPLDRKEAWSAFSADAGQWILRGYGMWIVEDKASGKTAGWIGFYEPERYDEPEIGWILLEEFEGKGIAYEAVVAARAYGGEHFGITKPCSFIAAENARSIALAERLGATREDTREGPRGAYHVYRHPEYNGAAA
ncbi:MULTISPECIES: GNAT family N-acetyltransferase [Halocynthiibacter]|uniref:GNAT family N-acetyltransferase n=1 Tax=Halocynthiibacter halioticoli TaxID=2986804 RepID=A0AAE3LUR6_9RHOB|nr:MULTISPECIES: GNAT family N-acetyltransferase [Halocynthiibacter]MCV6825450.1 GNAT family N-acetyltransferase [Halocynthiibacter halioticoli]MCW4058451.1 GNAT family N-acetyltransferase [Halocynthiibacter sp. SDUM655004]